MPNTYTQLHIQFVFAVKNRVALIQPSWKDRLQEYMTGIIQNNKHKLLQINNMPDHMHIFVGFRPHQAISSFVQNLKTESTKWIKAQSLSRNFEWQEGYGAFRILKVMCLMLSGISKIRTCIIKSKRSWMNIVRCSLLLKLHGMNNIFSKNLFDDFASGVPTERNWLLLILIYLPIKRPDGTLRIYQMTCYP